LSLAGLLLIVGLVVLSWYLSRKPNGPFVRVVGSLLWGLVLLFALFGIAGIALLVFSLFSKRTFGMLTTGIIYKVLKFIYPLAFILSRALNINKDIIRGSYIEVYNQITRYRLRDAAMDKILILAPHCLQRSDCPHKITIDVNNCRRCGKCPIDRLCNLAETYRVKLAVATGGTLARDFVKHYKPEAIIAIACERDLTSGIQDVTPLPVIGILNSRPNGPCNNTEVDFAEVELALEYLRKNRENISETGTVLFNNRD